MQSLHFHFMYVMTVGTVEGDVTGELDAELPENTVAMTFHVD